MTETNYEIAQQKFAVLAARLGQKIGYVEASNILIGAGMALLRSHGGDEMVADYLSELLDDVRLRAEGYLND